MLIFIDESGDPGFFNNIFPFGLERSTDLKYMDIFFLPAGIPDQDI